MRTPTVLAIRPAFLKVVLRNESTEQVQRTINIEKPKASTVDIEEVDHHLKLRKQWWDKNGPLKGLHSLNPLRMEFVKSSLANVGFKETNPCNPLEGIKILDVGCGAGILTESLAKAGANATGIDPGAELIMVAKQHAALDPSLLERINYLNSTIEEVSESNPESFDAVVASEVIEHITDKQTFLKYCVKALKPGGSILITTPSKTFFSWFGGIIIAEYMLNYIPRGTHDWNKFISPSDMQKMLENCGCKTRLIHGFTCNPLNNQWYWLTNTTFCYALHAIKDKGYEGKLSHEI